MKYALSSFALLLVFAGWTQEADPIVTDRPTQSAAALVIPKGNWMVEYGSLSERQDVDVSTLIYADLLIKYGLLDGLELRLTQDFLNVKDEASDISDTGLSPLTIGTKIHLFKGKGWAPLVSVIAQVTIPTGNEAFKPGRSVPELRLNMSNSLSDRFSLGYNFGMRFPEEGNSQIYSAVLGYSLPSGWTFFAEPYGFFGNGVADQRFNAGLIYLITNKLQVDVTAGWGLSEVSPDSFAGFGLAFGF